MGLISKEIAQRVKQSHVCIFFKNDLFPALFQKRFKEAVKEMYLQISLVANFQIRILDFDYNLTSS